MIELSSVSILVAAALAVAVAFLAGWSLGKKQSTHDDSREQELEETLNNLREKHEQYRSTVSAHFSQTAELVGQLTHDYRRVYEHLATGASELCGTSELPQTLQQAIESNSDSKSELDARAPLDYAPKSSPDEPGMLNERYGLETTHSK